MSSVARSAKLAVDERFHALREIGLQPSCLLFAELAFCENMGGIEPPARESVLSSE